MKIKVIWLVTVFLLLSSVTALADCSKHTTLFFVNGVDTKKESSEDSRDLLIERIGVLPSVNIECMSVETLYNINEPLFDDWLEAGLQLSEENYGSVKPFWEFYMRVSSGLFTTNTSLFELSVFGLFIDLNTSIQNDAYVLDDQLDEFLVTYRQAIDDDQQVILLGHSQGNLYVNKIWNSLDIVEQSQTRTIAVSTPSDHVGGSLEPYTTLHDDALAANVFSAIGALPTNTSTNEDCEDELFGFVPASWLCHGFKEAYMLGDEPREQILDDIVAALPSTESNSVIRGQTRTGLGEGIESNIALYDADYQLVASTTSDNNGYYSMLVPGCIDCYLFADTTSGFPYLSGSASISVNNDQDYYIDLVLYQLIPM